MNVISFTVPGRPIAAVRMTQKSKWVNESAQRYLSYKDSVGWCARGVKPKIIEGPVFVRMIFYLTSGRRGDIDNFQKSIMDGMNKICYKDDRQVVDVWATIKNVDSGQKECVEVQVKPA